MRGSSPRRAMRARSCQRTAPLKGDGAPKSANLWCPRSCGIAAGASRRATRAQVANPRAGSGSASKNAHRDETLAHAYLRCPYGTGPRFSPVRHARTRRPILQLAPSRTSYWVREELRHRPSAHVAYTSPQAPHLLPPHERLEKRPSSGRGGLSLTAVRSAGISFCGGSGLFAINRYT
jgi:hypothetical protein